MLKIAPLPDTLSGRGRSAIDDPQGVVRVGDILRFVQRYFLTILSAVFVSVVVAGIYLSNAKPIYTARAQVLIDPNTQQYLRPDGVGQLSLDTAQVEGEIALLRSENIALAVIEKFDLTSDPEFQAEEASMISKLFGNAPTASGQPSEQGSSEPGQDAAAEKADEDDGNGPAGPRSFPSPMMGTSGPEIGETSDYAKTRTALDIFLRKLDVRRVGYSYAIDISFNSVDPDKAALIANEVARAYIQDQIETVVQLARQGSNWL
ncbi:MAG: Wzz/FepE/Etk N-terminal domain-containing protein, partial [Hyphomicrobiales bacterium]|nr:Wzz/FepE/Etk N-terminal domain-containing protein [Hyphomicrobiales bacterium]